MDLKDNQSKGYSIEIDRCDAEEVVFKVSKGEFQDYLVLQRATFKDIKTQALKVIRIANSRRRNRFSVYSNSYNFRRIESSDYTHEVRVEGCYSETDDDIIGYAARISFEQRDGKFYSLVFSKSEIEELNDLVTGVKRRQAPAELVCGEWGYALKVLKASVGVVEIEARPLPPYAHLEPLILRFIDWVSFRTDIAGLFDEHKAFEVRIDSSFEDNVILVSDTNDSNFIEDQTAVAHIRLNSERVLRLTKSQWNTLVKMINI